MAKKKNFNEVEKKIMKILAKGGKDFSLNEIAKRIGETRYKTLKGLKMLIEKRWVEEV